MGVSGFLGLVVLVNVFCDWVVGGVWSLGGWGLCVLRFEGLVVLLCKGVGLLWFSGLLVFLCCGLLGLWF